MEAVRPYRFTLTRLYGAISQKNIIFILAAVRASNVTKEQYFVYSSFLKVKCALLASITYVTFVKDT
jgi:hypothetical protein